MQQDQQVINPPQGTVVGNRIVYNHGFLNCNYCLCYSNTRGRIILIAITLLFFFTFVFGFAFGSTFLGVIFLFFFLAMLLICIWNFYRMRTDPLTQQALIQNMNYSNQVLPPQHVPGPYQPTTYPLLPPQPQEYPQNNFYPPPQPSRPPFAVPYAPPANPPQLLPLKIKSSQVSSDQETQPLTQEDSELPSTTEVESSQAEPEEPPQYDAVIKESKEQEKNR